MIDPNNLIEPYTYLEEPPKVIKIDELLDFDAQEYDLIDEKDFKKYITDLERDIRKSYEYSQMVQYLREYIDMNACSFYENVNNIDSTKIKIEIHHSPFTLFDICNIVFRKRCEFRESLELEAVAKEVVYIHYNLMVGLISLSATVHTLVHNQYLFIPTSKVYGKYQEFVDRYRPWINPDELDVLERIENITDMYEDLYKTLLSKQFIYVDLEGAYDLPTTESINALLKDRIAGIMAQNSNVYYNNTNNSNINKPIQPMIFE